MNDYAAEMIRDARDGRWYVEFTEIASQQAILRGPRRPTPGAARSAAIAVLRRLLTTGVRLAVDGV